MTSLEYADRVLEEFRPGKKAEAVSRDGLLRCAILCTDGTVEHITGYWAVEIMKRADAEHEAAHK